MKVKVTEPRSWQRIVEIEIPAEQVAEEISSAYDTYRKEAVVPGFRKGKVPIAVLKARFSDAIENIALQELIPRAWEDARRQSDIDPISEPVVSDVDFKLGQPLRFKASVEVRPQIRLPDKMKFQVTRKEIEITEGDVQLSLEELRERHATIAPSEEPAAESDIVIVDTWRVDKTGVPIVGQNAADYPIDLGSSRVMPEYKQALLGAAIGDQKRVRVTYPADHPQKELAGQEASFLIQVKEVKRKTLPPLEDEFAKSIGDYPTLEALKKAIRENLEKQAEQRAKGEIEEQIIDQIIEHSSIEVPESMVGGYVEAMISDLRSESHKGDDVDQLRRSLQPLATRQVKRWFILEEVRKKEGLQVSDEELAAKVSALAQAQNIEPHRLHQQLASGGQLERLRRSVEEEKTLSFLVGKAHVKAVPAEQKRQ